MSTVVEIVESRALVGNPLGDATARRVAIWLPPSYAAATDRRFPVIYWLAGYAGTGEQIVDRLLGREAGDGIELDLNLDRPDPTHSRLVVTAVFRVPGGLPPRDPRAWTRRCLDIFGEMRRYLMAGT